MYKKSTSKNMYNTEFISFIYGEIKFMAKGGLNMNSCVGALNT
ncbi:hypothetical protein N481_14300 [Pseudoalteromonas luteoviolacea S4047-1]|uniref:Uncharacterized protein n=1 Tax=Pseudoalteromonas luteoviolacea S4054 TaxID=1129367 RepID=A0A0F6ADX8_9GAMM|nr:hypothetical protein N479_13165 [Pseudoalteromonas luteoviolacea S4054]KZN72793.1 hypothetical protein N481_14300 [Pseudoalteromonas luteoviolacea S4047-1]